MASSGSRRVGSIRWSSTHTSRSARSPARTPASIEVSTNARRNARTVMSSSVNSARSTIPSPVTALHKVSESHGGIEETLSSATVHEAAAVTAHCRTSRGADRSGAGEGSISETRNRAAVDFAVPCSPVRASIGCGISGTRAASSQAMTRPKPASSTFSSRRSSANPARPTTSGTHRGWVSAVRRNRTGELSARYQPPGQTTIARPEGSARSRTMLLPWRATRSATGTGRVSVVMPSMTVRASAREDAAGAVPVRA